MPLLSGPRAYLPTHIAVLRPDDHPGVVLSASDLTNFLACRRLTQEQLRAALKLRSKLPKPQDPHGDLVRRHGEAYEDEQLQRLSAGAGGHVEPSAPGYTRASIERAAAETERLLRAGAFLVYQGLLFDGRWQGRVDFLRRVDRPSALGPFAYEIVDTKLARQVKPGTIHQLSLYHRLLTRLQGDAVDHAVVLLGDGTEERVDLRRYAALHRRLVRRLEAEVEGQPVELAPEPVDHCGFCRLGRECHGLLREADHLSFVAGGSRLTRRRLVAGGIETLAQLAGLDDTAQVQDVDSERLEVLRQQAKFQAESRRTGGPTRRHLPALRARGYARLPGRDAGDVFFDFEGDPYIGADGLEYLWGWTTADGEYHAVWSHTTDAERAALERFVDWVDVRRAEHPGAHVFHYGAHEASKLKSLAQRYGTREDRIDAWLRAGVLVDLYAVVRQGLQVGEESYGLKRLERHYSFVRQEHTVRDGGGSIIAYEHWLETGDGALLDAIGEYNREDCLSTAALRDWLLDELRPEAARELGADFDDLAEPEPEQPAAEPAFFTELRPLLQRLLAGVPDGEDVEVDADQAERRLIAHLLLYHYREVKPQYWHWFALKRMTSIELVEEREAIGLIIPDGMQPIGTEDRSNLWRYRFAEQETTIEPNPYGLLDPTTGKNWARNIKSIGDDHLVLKVTKKTVTPPELSALINGRPPDGGKVRVAATVVATSLLDDPGRFTVARALLRRDPPAYDVRSVTGEVDDLVAAALALDGSYLAVQGPPGTGKTFRAAHMVVAALAAGRRVAVTANSHAAIQNLLRAIEYRARKENVTSWCGVYKGEGYASPYGLIASVDSDSDTDDAGFRLVAGTAWLMSNECHRGRFSLLFVDEAGQFALANAVAAATVADSVVLLGDPQQLPQVNQASHPLGAGASVLEHLAGGNDVLPADRGVFLERSRRMHPDVCRFVSELSYERELESTPQCGLRRVDAPGRLSGAGLRSVSVPHDGRSQASEEEADVIAGLVRELLDGGATVTDDTGAVRPLTAADVLVVAPYNLARRCIQERLPAVRVGTVDKFQGQEAPVVLFAMTCSSGEDVPRGLGFLFDRNRLNVAISRAQCLAVIVHAPRLLDADCRSLEHMRLLNCLCRLVELAEPIDAAPRFELLRVP